MALLTPNHYYKITQDITETDSFLSYEDALSVAVVDFSGFETICKQIDLPLRLAQKEKNIRLTRLVELDGCLFCTLNIPLKKDDFEHRAKLSLVIRPNSLIIIVNNEHSKTVLNRFTLSHTSKKITLERFLYELLESMVDSDLIFLEDSEKRLSTLEENVLAGNFDQFNHKIVPLKKEQMLLHNYYAQLLDVAVKLKNCDDDFFEQPAYFKHFSEKINLLFNYTQMLREYSIQIMELYQTQIDVKQNRVMKFLTGITTIFLPLTVITGWYGMNFTNMPELGWQFGYPVVILLSLIILFACIWFFRKKDFF